MKKFLRIAITTIALLVIFITGFILFFNRVPERNIPKGNVIVSPANGEIIHVEEVSSNEISFFKKETENTLTINQIEPPYNIVVIEMDLKDVHVQRAPIQGEVLYQEHVPGAHKNALTSENLERLANVNEKNIIVLQNEELSVGVIQVAGLAARRIQSFVEANDTLDKGEVYGRIVLGSQVVLVLPDEVSILVKEGDITVDGETIVGTY